jgi:hypothetical protein
MLKSTVLFGAVSILAFSTPAHALSISFNTTGVVPAYAGATLLEGFDETSVKPDGLAFKEFKEKTPGVQGTSKGSVRVYANSVINQALKPTNALGQFLSIGARDEGSYTLSLANIQVLSFVVGSLDAYNSVTLRNTNGSIFETLQGSALAGLTGPGQNGRVTYDFQGMKLGSITFSSSQAAFEIDQIYSAAPEPATWGMMILGFGIAGAALRRPSRKNQVTPAAV